MSIELILGDCIDAMKAMPDNSIDAVVTDPPYGLEFMGKDWDSFRATRVAKSQVISWLGVGMKSQTRAQMIEFQNWTTQWATEALRVLKPGGHLLSFGGTRTYHRMACAIEDAGFEIRDQLQWIYGSGFPKSLDVSKAIDKMAGAYVKGEISPNSRTSGESPSGCYGVGVQQKTIDIPQSPEAQYWQGWGTALKPAHEPIVLARKPITGTVANNVLAYGTGGINIDGCRVGGNYKWRASDSKVDGHIFKAGSFGDKPHELGRFPANVIHDGSDEVVGMFPVTTSGGGDKRNKQPLGRISQCPGNWTNDTVFDVDSGSAARFFYSAKASRSERNAGLEGMEEKRPHPEGNGYGQTTMWNGENGDEEWRKKNPNTPAANHHPTVKPIAVMRWLVRLITPPNGTVLDPFTGSGTTGIAAVLEGFDFIGIEREAEYHEIARRRIEHWQSQFQMRLPLEAE